MSEYIIKLPISDAPELFISNGKPNFKTIFGCEIVGEIVRCRDCKYYCDEFKYIATVPWCDYHDNFVDLDGFCAWGEGKEDA